MAEVHFVGQIIGASKFGKSNLFCIWDMQAGQQWIHISGDKKGQTQIDAPAYDEICIWSHPIDLHYSTSTPVGWPKLIFQVWYQDSYGRNDFLGYGVLPMPSQSGTFDLQCYCWRPVTNNRLQQFSESIIGGHFQLKDLSLISNNEERRKLKTTSSGIVHVQLSVILRNFVKYGVITSENAKLLANQERTKTEEFQNSEK